MPPSLRALIISAYTCVPRPQDDAKHTESVHPPFYIASQLPLTFSRNSGGTAAPSGRCPGTPRPRKSLIYKQQLMKHRSQPKPSELSIWKAGVQNGRQMSAWSPAVEKAVCTPAHDSVCTCRTVPTCISNPTWPAAAHLGAEDVGRNASSETGHHLVKTSSADTSETRWPIPDPYH
jgi:hypothetical protein